MSHILALLAVFATITGLAILRESTMPPTPYDYPAWAHRLALTIRAHLTRKTNP